MEYVEVIKKRKIITAIGQKYGVKRFRIFGSVARGDALPASDLDLLVTLEPGRSLFDLGGLQYELQQALRIPVDVITENGLPQEMRRRVLNEVVDL